MLRGNLFDGGDHEDQRDRCGLPRALPVGTRMTRRPSKVRWSCLTDRRITTAASTIRRWASPGDAAGHARRRPRGLSRLGRSREHAAAGLPDPRGHLALPCIGDGRQSGTSASPSILNAAPEAAVGGGLALLQTGDRVRIDLRLGTANVLLDAAVLEQRRQALQAAGGYAYPPSQTPGRRSSVRGSARWIPVRSSRARTNTSGSRRRKGRRVTIISPRGFDHALLPAQ